MNVTQGVPRIKEIINASKNISTPVMNVRAIIMPTTSLTAPLWLEGTLVHANEGCEPCW